MQRSMQKGQPNDITNGVNNLKVDETQTNGGSQNLELDAVVIGAGFVRWPEALLTSETHTNYSAHLF